uniref:Uncharacterized protein n=1 Tax=Caenorhabditis japonica TaxID=281687 RepID=A0A8R1HMA7_CAEJA
MSTAPTIASTAGSTLASAASTATTKPDNLEDPTAQTPSESESSYGKVKVPVCEPPSVTKTMEALYSKTKLDFVCGLCGALVAISLAVVCAVFAVSASDGKFMFYKLPNIRKLNKA